MPPEFDTNAITDEVQLNIKRDHCLFVLCRIAEHFVHMLVDTGTSKSLLSKDFYDYLDMTNVTSEKKIQNC